MRVLPKSPRPGALAFKGTAVVNMNKFRDPCVYALVGPGGEIGYVGSTNTNALNRRWQHIYRARVGHTAPVYEWMRQVGIENVEHVVLAREADSAALIEAEAAAIVQLLAEGHPLRNRNGLDGNAHSMSDETKSKIGLHRRGKPTWSKGKRGAEAGWTEDRRRRQAETIRARNAARAAQASV